VIEPEVLRRFLSLTEERARRRPLQHLTGTQAFWRHEFLVTPDVLIPRPETELLVEAALEALQDVPSPLVVDVGTGSGCIALSLAAERRDAAVHAVDVSEAALAVARRNARRLGLEDHVLFHLGDILGSVRSLAGRVHLVVSNPPYVDASEAASLAPEVRDHEPALALFAPGDRYSVIRRLAPAAAAALRPDGFLILEVGLGMADEVRGICEASRLAVSQVRNDLQGIPRAIVARRAAGPAAG
jgi:release factor glutamine methyltransferase